MGSFFERPTARRSTKRWTSMVLVSLCLIFTVVGVGRLFRSVQFIPQESLLKLLPYMKPSGIDSDNTFIPASIQNVKNDDVHPVEKRQPGNFVVTGINWNGIQLRREWSTFQADTDLFNLFLCGLEAWQGMSQNTRESYFQLAGIHGAPYVAWDGVSGSYPQYGYCTHASILFPTWHRPYLAAIEQIIGNLMRNLANQYPAGPTRSKYQNAANRFRLPYWDWARDSRVPDIIGNQPQVTVEKPQGFVRINNPLHSYRFHPFSPSFFPYAPFNSWSQTVRQPDPNGNSRPAEFNRQLSANQISLRNRVYNVLTYQHEYRIFSNKAWNGGNSGNQDSVESIHDLIHGVVGGGGHMAIVDTSAMDPLFWFHHVNVDRITTMWQTLNPNSYTQNQVSIFGTRTNRPGDTEGPGSPLTPFRQSSTGFWNSNSVRRHTIFGYTYPELADAGTVPDYRLRSRLRIRINDLYGSTAPQNQLRNQVVKRGSECARPKSPQLVKNHKYHEWTANVRINKYMESGPYLINIFVGAPTKNVEWPEDPNFAGSYYMFSKNGTCSGCAQDALVTGTVPLTDILIQCTKNGHLASLDPSSVVPYLKQKLMWRIQKPNEEYINPGELHSLKISVAAAEVTIPSEQNQDVPISTWTTYHEITTQKPGGLCYGDPA